EEKAAARVPDRGVTRACEPKAAPSNTTGGERRAGATRNRRAKVFEASRFSSDADRLTMDAPGSPTDGEQAASAPSQPAPTGLAPRWQAAKPTVLFLIAWGLLNAMMNVRYPQEEPPFWWLLPSVDVLILFFYFAVFGWNKWRVPTVVRVLV